MFYESRGHKRPPAGAHHRCRIYLCMNAPYNDSTINEHTLEPFLALHLLHRLYIIWKKVQICAESKFLFQRMDLLGVLGNLTLHSIHCNLELENRHVITSAKHSNRVDEYECNYRVRQIHFTHFLCSYVLFAKESLMGFWLTLSLSLGVHDLYHSC